MSFGWLFSGDDEKGDEDLKKEWREYCIEVLGEGKTKEEYDNFQTCCCEQKHRIISYEKTGNKEDLRAAQVLVEKTLKMNLIPGYKDKYEKRLQEINLELNPELMFKVVDSGVVDETVSWFNRSLRSGFTELEERLGSPVEFAETAGDLGPGYVEGFDLKGGDDGSAKEAVRVSTIRRDVLRDWFWGEELT